MSLIQLLNVLELTANTAIMIKNNYELLLEIIKVSIALVEEMEVGPEVTQRSGLKSNFISLLATGKYDSIYLSDFLKYLHFLSEKDDSRKTFVIGEDFGDLSDRTFLTESQIAEVLNTSSNRIVNLLLDLKFLTPSTGVSRTGRQVRRLLCTEKGRKYSPTPGKIKNRLWDKGIIPILEKEIQERALDGRNVLPVFSVPRFKNEIEEKYKDVTVTNKRLEARALRRVMNLIDLVAPGAINKRLKQPEQMRVEIEHWFITGEIELKTNKQLLGSHLNLRSLVINPNNPEEKKEVHDILLKKLYWEKYGDLEQTVVCQHDWIRIKVAGLNKYIEQDE